MTPGSQTWRAALGLLALTVVAQAGCHSVPMAKIAPTPNRPQSTIAEVGRAALLPATVALETPAEMSAMEPVRDGQVTEPSSRIAADPKPLIPRPASEESPPVVPAETPLLDAALQRAKGLEQAIVEEMTPPAEPLAPATPEPMPMPPPAAPEPDRLEKAMEASKPETVPAPPASLPPEDAWRDGIDRLSGLARDQAGRPGEAGAPWEFRTRVLAWLAEPHIDPDRDQPEARGLRSVLLALSGSPTGTPSRPEDVRSAIQVLEERVPMEITDLQLCLKVNGFGDYEVIDPPVRRAGQQVVIYSQIDGIRYESIPSGFRYRVAGQLEILPEGGGSPVWSIPLGIGDDPCRVRRRDFFIPYIFTVPKTIAPGRYMLRLTVRDLTSDRSATRDVPVVIARD
ncbi:hypothetical protein TA3x_004658 [Tundrisphaera sp. TA3]|uniref:hypothetical protein n=1 Tax=Tundrisphaera sp. TA3 TaxID=3435775 RepID=UPI003EBD9399